MNIVCILCYILCWGLVLYMLLNLCHNEKYKNITPELHMGWYLLWYEHVGTERKPLCLKGISFCLDWGFALITAVSGQPTL